MFLPLHDTNPIRHIAFPWVTYGLMAVTTLIFAAQSLLSPIGFLQVAIEWGMIPVVMLFLWVFGDNIEDALGHVRFVLFYLGCAAGAALLHLLLDPLSTTPLIGASGAVAGVMGAYCLLYPHARVYVLARIVIPIPLPVPAFWMLGVWIAVQIFNVVMGSLEPVSWWAHLGGFATGMVLAAIGKRSQVALLGGR
ncbi:MAG: rhomboid family intrarane serine protease [Devosia sp.]|nr:rhomboid family intrarane serine protease [Devosia sp.]